MNKDYHIYFQQYKLELSIDHGSLLTALTPTIMSCPALSVLQQMSPHSPQPQTHITCRRGVSTPIFLVPLYRQKNAPITHWLGIPLPNVFLFSSFCIFTNQVVSHFIALMEAAMDQHNLANESSQQPMINFVCTNWNRYITLDLA